MNNYILSEDEQDVLQELMNIAYGSATAVIAEMLEAFASLSIPNIQIMNVSELLKTFEELKNTSYFFLLRLLMENLVGGRALFSLMKRMQTIWQNILNLKIKMI